MWPKKYNKNPFLERLSDICESRRAKFLNQLVTGSGLSMVLKYRCLCPTKTGGGGAMGFRRTVPARLSNLWWQEVVDFNMRGEGRGHPT